MHHRTAHAVILVLLLVACSSYLVWRKAQDGLDAVEAELQQTVMLEALGMQQGKGALGKNLIDPEVSPSWQKAPQQDVSGILPEPPPSHTAPTVQLDNFDLHGEQVMAHVTVGYPVLEDEPLRYRETRFYQQTAEGWQRTVPNAKLLGAWLTVETKHFVIQHRKLDAESVMATAPELDTLYNRLRQDLGLPVADGKQKIGLELVTPDSGLSGWLNRRWVEPAATYSGSTEHLIVIPSIALLPMPAEFSEAALLQQIIVYSLADLLLNEIMSRHSQQWQQTAARWQLLLRSLRLWELWDQAGPLSVGQDDLAGWLYRNAQSPYGRTRQALPATYQDICRVYHLWQLSPLELSLPLTCTDSDQAFLLEKRLPMRLSYLIPSEDDCGCPGAVPVAGTVAMATVIEYAVATYGRERLPFWIEAVGQYNSWESLIPVVFAVPAADFEAGWQAYLARSYTIPIVR